MHLKPRTHQNLSVFIILIVLVVSLIGMPGQVAHAANLGEGFDSVVPAGWTALNLSNPVGPQGWMQGNSFGGFPAYSGGNNSYAAVNYNSTTGANTISNWLISPSINSLTNGDTVRFFTRTDVGSPYADRLQFRMSTNGTCSPGATNTDVGDFTTLLVDINSSLTVGAYPTSWTEYSFTLSGITGTATGCFAFRYFVPNGGPNGANSNYIGVDSFDYGDTLPTITPTPTNTLTPTITLTPSITPTASDTPTPTATLTSSPTETATSTLTSTNTLTNTPTETATNTETPTDTPTSTPTPLQPACFIANLDGTQPVPPNGSTATGIAYVTAYPPMYSLDIHLIVNDLSSPAMSGQIRAGAPGTTGPSLVTLLLPPGTSFDYTQTGAFLGGPNFLSMQTGNTYVTIETPAYPAVGEIRGQLSLASCAEFTATPTNTPSATNTATSTVTPSDTATLTLTPSYTPSATLTNTLTPSNTATLTLTPSRTPTNTPTFTPSSTVTRTPSNTATSTLTPSNTVTFTPTPSRTPTNTPTNTPVPPRADTVGVYKNGVFSLRNSNTAGAADITAVFGGDVSDLPIAGDWNGDGVDTIGVYRNSTGFFYLSDSNRSPALNYNPIFGNPGDTPFAGKWTADMTHDGIGVYRNSNGILYQRKALTGGFDDFFAVFGNPGDQGFAGDWDGNGFDSIGVYRSSLQTWYMTNNSTPNGITFSDIDFVWDITTYLPVVGDWDANGTSTVGYLTTVSVFDLHSTNAAAGSDNFFVFGPANGKPLAGKWIAASKPSVSGLIDGSLHGVTNNVDGGSAD